MSSEPSIVLIHSGESWYLPFTLQQARKAGRGSDVFLIGDGANAGQGIGSVDIESLENSRSRKFREVYRHSSPNPVKFEIGCFLRWFFLLEFMEREGLDDAAYLDSDVLLYAPASMLRERVLDAGKICGMVFPKQNSDSPRRSAAGHVSYWRKDALRSFCDTCLQFYENEEVFSSYERFMEARRKTGVRAGICDMTALYHFSNERPDLVHNFGEIHRGCVIDNNVGEASNFLPGEFEMSSGMKRVMFRDGSPYLQAIVGLPVRALALHFQGPSKKKMTRYYTGDGFPGKFRSEFRLWMRAAPKRLRNRLLRKSN